jgi:transposase
MASLIAKKKANTLYYYIVESARAGGKPRIVHQIYLGAADPLQQAQTRLLGVWKDKQLISRRLLAYDTTNFHPCIASANQRSQLAQRGHNKQGRHNLRQVGLRYVLVGEFGLSLCNHVYPGNLAGVNELPVALQRIGSLLDEQSIARDSVTLVPDKGSAALANTLALD